MTDATDQNKDDPFNHFVDYVAWTTRHDDAEYYERKPHRTFEWYVMALNQELDAQLGYDSLHLESYRPNKNTRHIVGQMMRGLYVVFHDKKLLPKAQLIDKALHAASISDEQQARLAYHFGRALKAYISRLKDRDDAYGTFRLVPARKRRSPRSRENLPDPSSPAWSTANRQPSQKVQIGCRVDAKIKKDSLKAASDRGISLAQWLSEAIVNQLQEEGFDAALEDNFRPTSDRVLHRKRPQRPKSSYPDSNKSRHASVNRADKITSIRIDEALAHKIDQVRWQGEDMSRWFNNACYDFMRSRARLPDARTGSPSYSISVSIRFERQTHSVIKATAKDRNLTVSEWLRRVAIWYIQNLKTDE